MISIYCLISLLAIHGILSSNSSSSGRRLIIPSCRIEPSKTQPSRERERRQSSLSPFEENEAFECVFLVSRTTPRHYYFYFSVSSLSSSSSAFHLFFCEHQQTTSYSSSGFSILSSRARLPLPGIEDEKHSSAIHHPNAVDQSSSTTSNTIILMSSSADESSISTTSTGLANLSLPIILPPDNQPLNMILLIGCILIGIALMIMIYLIVKYCQRNEGTYKIDESGHFLGKSPPTNPETSGGCTGVISSSNQHRLLLNEQKLEHSKEWYV